jgi:hypothetical protein
MYSFLIRVFVSFKLQLYLLFKQSFNLTENIDMMISKMSFKITFQN